MSLWPPAALGLSGGLPVPLGMSTEEPKGAASQVCPGGLWLSFDGAGQSHSTHRGLGAGRDGVLRVPARTDSGMLWTATARSLSRPLLSAAGPPRLQRELGAGAGPGLFAPPPQLVARPKCPLLFL